MCYPTETLLEMKTFKLANEGGKTASNRCKYICETDMFIIETYGSKYSY